MKLLFNELRDNCGKTNLIIDDYIDQMTSAMIKASLEGMAYLIYSVDDYISSEEAEAIKINFNNQLIVVKYDESEFDDYNYIKSLTFEFYW